MILSIIIKSLNMKIYTKTGDKGTSSLYNGRRVPKEHEIFAAVGNVDELNSVLGVASVFVNQEGIVFPSEVGVGVCNVLQAQLFDVGACLATPINDEKSRESQLNRVKFRDENVSDLEKLIDCIQEKIPPLKRFILPGGGSSVAGAQFHICRSVCRRAERSIVELANKQGGVPEVIIKYINRMSDLFFVMARYCCCYNDDTQSEMFWEQNLTIFDTKT